MNQSHNHSHTHYFLSVAMVLVSSQEQVLRIRTCRIYSNEYSGDCVTMQVCEPIRGVFENDSLDMYTIMWNAQMKHGVHVPRWNVVYCDKARLNFGFEATQKKNSRAYPLWW